jgi:hypothetical protein
LTATTGSGAPIDEEVYVRCLDPSPLKSPVQQVSSAMFRPVDEGVGKGVQLGNKGR